VQKSYDGFVSGIQKRLRTASEPLNQHWRLPNVRPEPIIAARSKEDQDHAHRAPAREQPERAKREINMPLQVAITGNTYPVKDALNRLTSGRGREEKTMKRYRITDMTARDGDEASRLAQKNEGMSYYHHDGGVVYRTRVNIFIDAKPVVVEKAGLLLRGHHAYGQMAG
jgi:hypothetical protein